ncbi:MAG: FAD-binding protein [Clostridia bacterium]|nr:FAD-binding protein [Clostridia bacterium]
MSTTRERLAVSASLSKSFAREARDLLGPSGWLDGPAERAAYAYDATGERRLPAAVALPSSAEETAAFVALCARHRVPIVPRGAGTNLSGGSLPTEGGVVLALARLQELRVDPARREATVGAGCTNLRVGEAAARHGLFYAPDPSSQRASTIGGNVAENAGGPHCFKYGVTADHVLALEVVLADGTRGWLHDEPLNRKAEAPAAPDPLPLLVGSEGTLAVVTAAHVRLLPLPAHVRTLLAVFPDMERAVEAVSAIVAGRIVPATIEFIDQATIRLVERYARAGYPEDAGAVLVIEVDGPLADVDRDAPRVAEICRANGASEVRIARTAAERDALWLGRRAAYGATGLLSRHVWSQDVVVPRPKLPEMLRRIVEVGARYGVPLPTVGHVGDGNLHPLIPFDPADPATIERMRAIDAEVLRACAELGGTVTGEHGVGVDKLEPLRLVFGPDELDLQWAFRRALDPDGILNPGKALPAVPPPGSPERRDLRPPAQRLPLLDRGRVDVDAGNLTARVAAGVTVAELREAASAEGLDWPAGWDADPSAEVLDVIRRAGRPGWPSRARVRHGVLAVAFAGGGGRAWRFGAATVKNVAGYAVHKAFVGAGEAAASLAEATLKLEPAGAGDGRALERLEDPAPGDGACGGDPRRAAAPGAPDVRALMEARLRDAWARWREAVDRG